MEDHGTKLLSIVIPAYNEESNIPLVYDSLCQVMGRLPAYTFEIIFVNDSSTDDSQHVLETLADKDTRVKYIEFSRNFGKEIAITAGIVNASGDAAIMLDADMQHPPELVPEFVSKWERGADMVVGIRAKNMNEGFIKRTGSIVFYSIVNAIGETKITPNATDYRLIDQRIITAFQHFTEKNRITRGLLDWMGFKRDYVYFDAHERRHGRATYSYRKLLGLAIKTFVSHSNFLLKFAGYIGTFITLVSGTFGLFILIEQIILGDPMRLYFTGPAILAVINLFLVGIILMCLGLIAMYIGNIHDEVLARPIYIIRRRKNFGGSGSDGKA